MIIKKSNVWTILVPLIVLATMILIYIVIAKQGQIGNGRNALGPTATKELSNADEVILKITNRSKYNLSPGVLLFGHNDVRPFDLVGKKAPMAYEPLAEVGNPKPIIEYLATSQQKLVTLIETKPIEPGGTMEVPMKLKDFSSEEELLLVSFMAMIVESNDGVVAISEVPIYEAGKFLTSRNHTIEVLDIGTEKNASPGSGFASGQPDLVRGEENINNGTPTNNPVSLHPELANIANKFSFELMAN